MMKITISSTAQVSKSAILGDNVYVWDYSKIGAGAVVEEDTNLGSYVYVDNNVKIGKRCKIQNGAQIFDPALISDGVFIGPSVILTNDKQPRAITSGGSKKNSEQWLKSGVNINTGASIGAGSICIAPVSIGSWAMVGAGSVVTRDVLDFAVVVGNPATQIGWVGKAGVRLKQISESIFQCPDTDTRYSLSDGVLSEIVKL